MARQDPKNELALRDCAFSADLATMAELASDAKFIADAHGTILHANPSAQRLGERLGFPADAGDRLILFDPRLFDTAVLARIIACVDSGERFNELVHFRGTTDIRLPVIQHGAVARDSEIWLNVTAFRLGDEGRTAHRAAFVLQDMTDEVRRKAKARIRTEGAEARVKIGEVLSSSAPLKQRFEESVSVILEMEQLAVQKKGGVFLLEDGDDRLRMYCHIGEFSHAFLEDENEVMLGSCLCGRAAISGEIIVSDNCFEDERHDHAWPNMTPHGHYIVPLMAEDACKGVLFLYTDVNPTHEDERIDALHQIGTLMANAITRERDERRVREAHERLEEIQTRFELAIEGSRDAIFDWRVEEDTVFYSSRWGELLSVESDELEPTISTLMRYVSSSDVQRVKREFAEFIRGTDHWLESEFRLVTSDGRVVWALCRAAVMRNADGVATRASGSVADISGIKAVEEEMRRMVQQDQLTGLASRGRLMERLEHALARNRRNGKQCAVLFFDFDRFKIVNDSLGHDVGDELLCSIASRLRENVRECDTVARFGGDEFVVLLEDLDDPEGARVAASKLLNICAEPHVIRGHRLVSTASIGLVTSEMAGCGASEMIRDADAAMYQAKSDGKGRVVEFDQAMHRATLERLELEDALRTAIQQDQFHLCYQPIVNLDTGHPVGAEALLRWTHPERGGVAPDVFISIAEESGQIQALGRWVLDEACRQLVLWKERSLVEGSFYVSVNLSKVQLMMPGFAEELDAQVREAGLAPSHIKLEVTETTIVDNRAGIAEVLCDLRARGFIVMMDDFGTGHSSLSGLHSLPIDELKIDQSFIRHEDTSREVIAITSSIISLADHLSLRTIGEGIETLQHVALLQDFGCDFGQGYYFAKPLPASEFEQWYRGKGFSEAA